MFLLTALSNSVGGQYVKLFVREKPGVHRNIPLHVPLPLGRAVAWLHLFYVSALAVTLQANL